MDEGMLERVLLRIFFSAFPF